MKQQVIVIHGGDVFNMYADYISYLKNKIVTTEYFKFQKDWKGNLQEKLGEGFEVFNPRMPNSTNARYEEWRIWFEKLFPFLTDNLILIGHSMGGNFLAKYLSENKFPKTIKATILAAASFDAFKFKKLTKFAKQGGKIYLIHSKDDPTVPFTYMAKYKQALPGAEEIVFTDRGHFKHESFPELVELIKKL